MAVMSGNKMREWLNELLFPLQGKVDSSTTAGIRTDIEKTIAELRREAKSALEANAALTKDRESEVNAIVKLKQENAELKIQLQSMEQRLQGAKGAVAGHASELQDFKIEYEGFVKTHEPEIDFGVLAPDESWTGGQKEWVDKIAQQAFDLFLQLAFKPGKPPDDCVTHEYRRAIQVTLISRAITYHSHSLLEWAVALTAEDLDKILCVGFSSASFIDKLINGKEAYIRIRNMRRRAVNTVDDWQVGGKLLLSVKAAKFFNDKYNVMESAKNLDLIHLLSQEIVVGNIVSCGQFKFKCYGEITPSWMSAAIYEGGMS